MPLHTNSDQSEADRLAVLQEYAVVDTALEPEFDLLARIAAEICGTEMAGINLVPHEHSFCEHTVAVGSTIVVADALADERFRDSPLVTGGPRIRFYAGAPLKARGGDVLGTLCVMDGRPRELSERQVELLEGLAKQVTLVIELRRDLTELDFARRRIGHDESLAHVAAWEWEVHSDIATWTPELRSLYGVGPELEGSYANFLALVHEDDRDYVSGAIEAALESGAKFSFRNRIVRPDGVVRTFDTRGEPWLGTDGEPLGLWGATADVTEIVESERRSREQLEGMQAAFLTALDPIFVADKERRFVQGNPAALGLLGYTIEQLVEMRIEDVVAMPPDEAIAIWESFVEVGHQRGELALRRADGSRAVAEFSATADFVPGLHLVVLRDVTERREAERDALESRRRLEETQSLARVGSWEWDLGTKLYIASDEMLRILERPAGKPQPTNKEFIGYVHPDDRDAFVEVVEQALRSAAPYRQVFRVITETGEVRTIESHGRVGVDAKGKPTRMFGAAQDITEREQVAQDLRLQAEVLDQLPVAVIASGADRRITLWNSAAQTIFGLDRAQALGKRFDDLGLASPAAESARAQMHVRLADGESWKGEIELQNAEGRAFPALVTNSPIRDHRGAVLSYVGVVVDMTEQRTIESELRVQGQILDQVQSAVITLDVKGRVTHWSKGAERLYGWTAEQMLGRPSAELDSSGPRPGITREHVQTEVISSGRWEGEIVVRHKDGTTIPVLSTCSAIVDAAGKLTGFIGVAVDISSSKAGRGGNPRGAAGDDQTARTGRRNSRLRNRWAHRADRGDRGGARGASRARGRAGGADPRLEPDARRRQDRDRRRGPAEAGCADGGGANADGAPRPDRPRHPRRVPQRDARHGGFDRPHPPRAHRRDRLPATPQGGGDPGRGPDRRRRRCLRRADLRPRLPQGVRDRKGDRDHARGSRQPVRRHDPRPPAREPGLVRARSD